MAVYHFQNCYIDQYSISDSDIVHFLGNYAGFAEIELMEIAEKELSEEKLKKDYAVLLEDVRRVLYEDFKKVQALDVYNDFELAKSIMFPNPKDEDNYYKNAMIVIVKVMIKLQKEIGLYKGTDLCRERFGTEAAFLYQILYQICEFTSIVATRQESKNYSGLYSRKQRLALETYRMAKDIPRGVTYTNDVAHFSESIFLIRQTIELKVIEVLQLKHVWNKKYEREVKISPNAYLDILDTKEIKFFNALSDDLSISINYIKDVHRWTNMFIHTGHTYWTWEVEFIRESIADFALAQVKVDNDYMKSIPSRILGCVKDEEKADAVVIMADKFYQESGISYPKI